MAKITLISGSPTANSRLNGLMDYCTKKLQEQGHEITVLLVAELPAEDLIRANFASPAIEQATALVEQADAVIIASPVYKASYTGVLKTFLDLIPQKGLQDKIIVPLFIGGTMAHLLSIDYALKPVLSVLGATTMLQGVYGTDASVARLDVGGFELAAELVLRLDEMLAQMERELEHKVLRGV